MTVERAALNAPTLIFKLHPYPAPIVLAIKKYAAVLIATLAEWIETAQNY
jgi:hypothetical protein